MKKTYLQPSMEVHQIRTAQVLMSSGYEVFTEEYDAGTMTDLAHEDEFDFGEENDLYMFEEE
ncbi:MAG: hypothetical protein J6N98_00020 [Prevotella sp.]|nr:hypothetical protein [Prevotella sp.]